MSDELIGKRVRLIRMNDPYGLEPGSEGTVIHIDDLGTLHVSWDGGSSLGLIPGEDKWEILPDSRDVYPSYSLKNSGKTTGYTPKPMAVYTYQNKPANWERRQRK